MSMAAKSSDLGDKMSEANLQVDGQVEKPAQGPVDQWGDGGRGWFPSQLTNMVPCPEATIGLPQYKTLLRNMSDSNG